MYAPLLIMLLFSFNSTKSTSVFSGFSLHWYEEMFRDRTMITSLKNTLRLAAESAVIATILGTSAAVAIHRMRRGFFRSSVMTVTNIPMMNPDIVTGVSMMLLFAFIGSLLKLNSSLNFYTMLIAHITFNLPYVILSVLPKYNQMDSFLPEAALDLGASPIQSFFLVELPAIRSGVLSGLVMAFTLSIDDFIISHYTGNGFMTLPLLIESEARRQLKPDVYALSSLVFVSILVLMIAANLIQARSMKKTPGNK